MSSADKTDDTSNETEGSEGNSKYDENLIQNWSLTFTEYANQNNLAKHDSSENINRKARAPKINNIEGGTGFRNTADVFAKGTKLKVNSNDYHKNMKEKVSEHIELVLPKQKSQFTTDTDGNKQSISDDIDSDVIHAQQTKVRNDENENEITKQFEDNVQTAMSRTHIEDEFSKISLEREISLKQEPLPSIKRNSEAKGLSSDSINETQLAVPEASVATSLGLSSGSRPPINTPHNQQLTGKVQPIYMRFPGQRTGQMVYAEMNQQSGRVRIVGRDKEKEMLARLSWLLLDAGTSALKVTFDSVHPPLNLREHLQQSHVKAVLQRLLQQGVLSDKQWKLLYPAQKRTVSSQKFDSRTLVILLETICHLCPPYPHGWNQEPLSKDGSLSADIVRLQLLFQDITKHDAIPGELYSVMFVQIRDVIVRLGGPPIRLKIARIEAELINLDLQDHYIKTLRDAWQKDNIRKLEKVHESRTRTSKTRKAYANRKGAEEGLSAEDRVTLKKTYKLMVDTIQAEDVLDRLQQSQIIKFSDRQEILAVSKKSERMQMLLDKISESKLPYALKALLDAMKFKYKKLYDHVMAIRKQTYKDGVVSTIDYEGITHDALTSYYKALFSRVHPFPWSDKVHATIRDIYTPLDILDSDGRKLHTSELLPRPCLQDKGQRVLVQGASGSGKSYFCAWLTYMWATQPNYFKHQYQHLLYLDMNSLKGNMETAIYKQLLADNFKLSITDFWAMLERNAHDVIIIVDGLDQSNGVNISDILQGRRLQKSTVLVVANPDRFDSSSFTPDTKWFNLGFSEGSVKRCFKNYVTLSHNDHDQFEKLYHLAGRESWALRPHLANPMLAVMTFAVFYVLRKGTLLKEIRTTCELLQKYGIAMATLYCRKQNIDIIGFEFPDEVLRAIDALDKFAFRCLIDNRVQFTEAEILQETKDPIVLKFGAFSKFQQGTKLRFTSGITLDFLAAKHIADMVYDEIEVTILRNKMVKLPKYKQLMSFLYGQYRDDLDTQILQTLFDQLAARNEYCFRGNYLPVPSISSTIDGDAKVKLSRGIIQDFATSMQCIAECTDRPDMVTTIAQSLPQRLIIKIKHIVNLKCIQGLCEILMNEECVVIEIELEFHQYHHFTLPLFLQLAIATGKCRSLTSIRITWSSLDLMSKFLAKVMEGTNTIDTVILIEDLSRKPVNNVTAATWAALQSASSNMIGLKKFAFLNGRITAILYNVLQHIPTSITEIDLTGSAFNLMVAGQLADHLHGNYVIRSLDLSNTKLLGTEFVAIFQGMQMCESIRHVRIRGAHLDRQCVIALSEYMKLTHSLEVLDLSNCELNTDMCTRLVYSIRQNRTLNKLVFNNTKLTSEGRRVMSKTKTKTQPVHVEGLVESYG